MTYHCFIDHSTESEKVSIAMFKRILSSSIHRVVNSTQSSRPRCFSGRIATPTMHTTHTTHGGSTVSSARAFFTKENIPPIALVVGCVALCFQIGVLYPWHEVLSEEFTELQVAELLSLLSLSS
jgi:uncharacterized membrane protein